MKQKIIFFLFLIIVIVGLVNLVLTLVLSQDICLFTFTSWDWFMENHREGWLYALIIGYILSFFGMIELLPSEKG